MQLEQDTRLAASEERLARSYDVRVAAARRRSDGYSLLFVPHGADHTWTAPSNTAMHHTNTAMGFRVVEHMYEVEIPLA